MHSLFSTNNYELHFLTFIEENLLPDQLCNNMKKIETTSQIS